MTLRKHHRINNALDEGPFSQVLRTKPGEVALREKGKEQMVSVHGGRDSAAREGNWKYRPVALTKQQLFRDLRDVKWNLNAQRYSNDSSAALFQGIQCEKREGILKNSLIIATTGKIPSVT